MFIIKHNFSSNLGGTEYHERFASADDCDTSLRAKPTWFDKLITPYEGYAEGPPRAPGNAIKNTMPPIQVDAN